MIIYIVLFCLLFLSVLSDLRTSKIRNKYIFPVVLVGLVINSYLYGFKGFKYSAVGIVVPILLLGVFFFISLIGAGDIKLFSAIGALLGGCFVLYAMAYSFMFAGIFALMNLSIRAKLKSTFSDFYQDIKMCFLTRNTLYFKKKETKHIIKLSPAIAMGAFFQMLLCLF